MPARVVGREDRGRGQAGGVRDGRLAVGAVDKHAGSAAAGRGERYYTPLTGLLDASRTVAVILVANAVPRAVLCGVPAVGVIDAAGPALLVSKKLAGLAELAVAVTV